MFTVATPAATKALTTLEAVKADLGISGSAEDAYLTEKINQASAAVCRLSPGAAGVRWLDDAGFGGVGPDVSLRGSRDSEV
ncbi:phage head-tail connector protein [Bradyrhizobium elkanii]|uniref:phage head-tail connector protein n=1 Tax=Bradyrhizobium elkanii TaxID=29448 RepID=UPI003512C51F